MDTDVGNSHAYSWNAKQVGCVVLQILTYRTFPKGNSLTFRRQTVPHGSLVFRSDQCVGILRLLLLHGGHTRGLKSLRLSRRAWGHDNLLPGSDLQICRIQWQGSPWTIPDGIPFVGSVWSGGTCGQIMDQGLAYTIFECLFSFTTAEFWAISSWMRETVSKLFAEVLRYLTTLWTCGKTLLPIHSILMALSHSQLQQTKSAQSPCVLWTEP